MLVKLIAIILSFYSLQICAFELGVGMHIRSHNVPAKENIRLLKASGFSSFREDFPWARVEKVKGIYSVDNGLQSVDSFIHIAGENGISSLVVLDYGNRLYTGGGYPQTNQQIQAFARYAYWTARRYKGKVKYYEIWNEWLVKSGVPGQVNVPGPTVYLKLIRAVSSMIRKADPGARILVGSMNPLVRRDRQWMLSLMARGVMDMVDGVSIHPYSYMFHNKNLNMPVVNLNVIDEFERELRNSTGKRADIPIYITEYGYPTNKGKYGVPEVRAANWIVAYTLQAMTRKYIQGIWWYDLIDDGVEPGNKEHHFGFYDINRYEKKSAELLQQLTKMVQLTTSVVTPRDTRDPALLIKYGDNIFDIRGKNGDRFHVWCPADTSRSDGLCKIEKIR